MISWSLVLVLLGLVLLLVGLSGLLSALESASLTVNRQMLRSLEASGDEDAADAIGLLANTQRILAGSLTGTLFTLLAAAGLLKMALGILLPALGGPVDSSSSFWWVTSSALWTFLLLPPAFLLLGELIPRHWCRQHPDAFVRLSAGRLRWLVAWWMPIGDWLGRTVSHLLHLFGLQGGLEPIRFTRDDLRALVEPSPDSVGPSPPGSQRAMIRSILSLGGTLVREVMRPLGEVVAIRMGDMTPRQVIEFARHHKFSRYPVYRDRMIDLIGYINVYDLLSADPEGTRLEDFLHEPLYVPETARVAVLMHEFSRQKTQCAIVFDEHGSCSGWVTREDVVEEILGDLDVEGDPALLRIHKEAEGVYRVDPRLDIDDLNRLLDVSIEKIHCETVGGFVYSVLGRVPIPGERIYLRRWMVEVVEMDRHVVRSVRLVRRPEKLPEP